MPSEHAVADVKVKKPVSLKKDNGVWRNSHTEAASSRDENLLRNRGASTVSRSSGSNDPKITGVPTNTLLLEYFSDSLAQLSNVRSLSTRCKDENSLRNRPDGQELETIDIHGSWVYLRASNTEDGA